MSNKLHVSALYLFDLQAYIRGGVHPSYISIKMP
jgi:hypothetical protein